VLFFFHLRLFIIESLKKGGASCTPEVIQAMPILKKAYGLGDSTKRILHVGPDSCSVVSTLLKDDGTHLVCLLTLVLAMSGQIIVEAFQFRLYHCADFVLEWLDWCWYETCCIVETLFIYLVLVSRPPWTSNLYWYL
jgi:hypothetical protein